MISETFSRAFDIAKERWAHVLGATILPAIGLVIALAVLIPVLLSLMTVGGSAPGSFETGSVPPSAVVPADPGAFGSTPSGTPVGGVVSPPAAEGGGAAGAAGMALALVGSILVFSVFFLAVTLAGVAAASDNPIGTSIKIGFTRLPHAVVQVLKVAWPAMAAIAVMLVLFAAVSLLLGLLALPVALILYLRAVGVATIAIGSVAHGHVTFSVAHVRDAVAGRASQAGSAAFVANLLAGALGAIPLVGPFLQIVWTSSFVAAMWEEFDDSSPIDDGRRPQDGGGATGVDDPGAAASSPSTTADAPAAVAALAAVTPLPVPTAGEPTPATHAAGPSWYAAASPTEPAGAWIQLAAPGRVALTTKWATGAAPALHLADEAGTWRTPELQPTSSGQQVWLDLPAGNTWVALVPSGPQQLWCSTLVPAAMGGSPAAQAA